MHELSIIHSIIETASSELARRGNRHQIEEITLKIGELAGIETDSIIFLWSAAVERTPLENAVLNIEHIPGKARCTECQQEFQIAQFYDPCPKCQSHFIEILAGEELQIASLILEDTANPESKMPGPALASTHSR
ncbi:MAG: hydrogenase maturation nickel metallochaperone HypA [Lewinellaceae bacterium]|nr:hydrogenase maturation nickel metallochaperone HypA [Lewinellaceae bacterium]